MQGHQCPSRERSPPVPAALTDKTQVCALNSSSSYTAFCLFQNGSSLGHCLVPTLAQESGPYPVKSCRWPYSHPLCCPWPSGRHQAARDLSPLPLFSIKSLLANHIQALQAFGNVKRSRDSSTWSSAPCSNHLPDFTSYSQGRFHFPKTELPGCLGSFPFTHTSLL